LLTNPSTESPRRQLLDKAMKLFNSIRSGSIEIKRVGEHQAYEYDRAIAGDIAAELAVEEPKYRCFHCGDEFHDDASAREHFGESEVFNDKPVCVEARSTTLEALVATNRELWTELLKERQEHETHEFQLNCWEEVGRKLTGKVNANWHDFAADGAAMYERERSRRQLSENFLKYLLREYMAKDPVGLGEIFRLYDPLLIPPAEYLESLERP
jgi:hypothetical protein